MGEVAPWPEDLVLAIKELFTLRYRVIYLFFCFMSLGVLALVDMTLKYVPAVIKQVVLVELT